MADRKRTARRPARATSSSRGRSTKRKPTRRRASRGPIGTSLRRRRVVVRLVIGGMVIVALLFAFVFPARTLLAQRQQTQKQRERLELLREQTRKLEAETMRLQDDAEIERIARARYNFVRPGEHPYVVVPPPTTAPPPSTAAPTTTSPARPGSKP